MYTVKYINLINSDAVITVSKVSAVLTHLAHSGVLDQTGNSRQFWMFITVLDVDAFPSFFSFRFLFFFFLLFFVRERVKFDFL